MAKKDASVTTNFNIINIKLRLAEAEEASAEDYSDLLLDVVRAPLPVRVAPSVGIIMKRCTILRVGGNVILWGYLTRYTPVDTNKLLNLTKPDIDEAFVLPNNFAPNPKDTAFFFTPENHRLALSRRGDPIPVTYALNYFKAVLNKVKKHDQLIDIYLEKAENTFKDVTDATTVKRIQISITYSNNDLNKELADSVDSQMKNANMRKLLIEAIADDSVEGIDFSKSDILQGALSLAESNGTVEATVVDVPGRRPRRVATEEHPREESVRSASPADIARDMYAKLMNLFPRG